VIARSVHRAGVPGSAHWLRHWYGTELVRAGADTRTAQELLRHASLQSTQVYLQVSSQQRAVAVQALPNVDVEVTPPRTPRVDAVRRRAYRSRVGVTPAQVRPWARHNG
jgi:hypothetical protein